MLETLLTAVESESQFIDIARVSGFMQKVRLPFPVIGNPVFSRLDVTQVRNGVI